MTQDTQQSGRWDRKTIIASAICLLLPFFIPFVQAVFGIFTTAQVLYGELGIVAALLCCVIATVKSDQARLVAALAFLVPGLVPILTAFLTQGEWLSMLKGASAVLVATFVFLLVLLAVQDWRSRQEASEISNFTLFMCLVAMIMHAFLFPYLLGEPLRSGILYVADSEGEIIETNPDGTLLLTHSALMPVGATLFAHNNGVLEVLQHQRVNGYPVGIRVAEDHALIALRIQNENKEVSRIELVRFSASDLAIVGSYPCTPEESPSHLINNLSPEGALLALADGGFAEMATGTRRDLLPPDVYPSGSAAFQRWNEPEGEAIFLDDVNRQLIVVNPIDGAIETLALEEVEGAVVPGGKQSTFQYRLIRRSDGRTLWHEETRPVSPAGSPLLPEGIESPPALFSGAPDTETDDATPPSLAGRRITHIAGTRALVSISFDDDRRFGRERHTQLLDMTTHAALARESNWLFWVTQAPHGEGTAIHGKQLR
jgi:hypothetical protein